jgi:hypothetical protein
MGMPTNPLIMRNRPILSTSVSPELKVEEYDMPTHELSTPQQQADNTQVFTMTRKN